MTPQPILVQVINLDRRPDRWARIHRQLNDAGITTASRLSAVDGAESTLEVDETVLSRSQVACWLSHQVAFDRLTSSEFEYGLILEDDASFSPEVINYVVLAELSRGMKAMNLDLLQIGWIESMYPKLGLRNLLDYVLAKRSGRLLTADLRVALGEFRAGTHSYIISKNFAAALAGKNVPAAFPADDFFTYLAKNCLPGSRFVVARLRRSRVSQSSRLDGASLDSDVV